MQKLQNQKNKSRSLEDKKNWKSKKDVKEKILKVKLKIEGKLKRQTLKIKSNHQSYKIMKLTIDSFQKRVKYTYKKVNNIVR